MVRTGRGLKRGPKEAKSLKARLYEKDFWITDLELDRAKKTKNHTIALLARVIEKERKEHLDALLRSAEAKAAERETLLADAELCFARTVHGAHTAGNGKG